MDTQSQNGHSNAMLQGKGFFLTWPKCPVSKQVCADMLATKGDIVKGLVG